MRRSINEKDTCKFSRLENTEQHRPISDRRNMDTCLRRLKQELLSMRAAGDGLQAEMNSMMGALQELKLLQLQTALERLEITGQQSQSPPPRHPAFYSPARSYSDTIVEEDFPLVGTPCGGDAEMYRSNLTKVSSDVCHTCEDSSPVGRFFGDKRSVQEDCYYTPSGFTRPVPWRSPGPVHTASFQGTMQSLYHSGQSIDSDLSEASTDCSSDWTSTLMSRGRNRQPLVLGDNTFADLVGNWLDLPEPENQVADGNEKEDEGKEEPAHPVQLSRSQEMCRKLSLTTQIFKKLLRTVRPDKDKLLKEKPGWMAQDGPEAEVLKRPKKVAKPKGSFYFPFWSGSAGQQGKSRPGRVEGRRDTSGIYPSRAQPEAVGKQSVFDYSTAVWV